VCDQNGCHDQSSVKSDDDTPVNQPSWSLFASSNSRRIRQVNQVTAVGWTKDLPPPLTMSNDHVISRGRTAVVAHGRVTVTKLDTIGLGMEQVRDSDLRQDDERKGEGARPLIDSFVNGPTYRFTLPTRADGSPIDPTQILVRAPVDLHRIVLLSSKGWKVSPVLLTTGVAFRLAPEDVIAGTVTVRILAGDHFQQRPLTATGPYVGWHFTEAPPADDEVAMQPAEVVAAAEQLPVPAPAASTTTGGAP
jgi:hypothetical protein